MVSPAVSAAAGAELAASQVNASAPTMASRAARLRMSPNNGFILSLFLSYLSKWILEDACLCPTMFKLDLCWKTTGDIISFRFDCIGDKNTGGGTRARRGTRI
jgi:hypothetical protein